MPELPEVETIRGQLNQVLKGRKLKEVEVLKEKSFQGDKDRIEGATIEEIKRKAKVLEIVFREWSWVVVIHLKMTGQLIFEPGKNKKRVVGGHPTPDWVSELPSKHTRVVWYFEDGSKLYFNDMRVFGWMKVMERKKYEDSLKEVSPDVTDQGFTVGFLTERLGNSKKAIKLVMLDQEKMGGLGNIYINEALYLAGIRPDRVANQLTRKEIDKLFLAVKKVIGLGIKYGGASASNYVQTTGLGGTYQDHFLIYQKDGEVCPKCGEVIRKLKMGGRGTFYCPGCQK